MNVLTWPGWTGVSGIVSLVALVAAVAFGVASALSARLQRVAAGFSIQYKVSRHSKRGEAPMVTVMMTVRAVGPNARYEVRAMSTTPLDYPFVVVPKLAGGDEPITISTTYLDGMGVQWIGLEWLEPSWFSPRRAFRIADNYELPQQTWHNGPWSWIFGPEYGWWANDLSSDPGESLPIGRMA